MLFQTKPYYHVNITLNAQLVEMGSKENDIAVVGSQNPVLILKPDLIDVMGKFRLVYRTPDA